MESWCTIESDPGVFTQLIREIGVEGVQVVELYGLDESCLDPLDHIYGFIFLFKWDHPPASEGDDLLSGASYALPNNTNNENDKDVFFAQQLVPNACATQAILSILMNIDTTDQVGGSAAVQLGSCLSDFKNFTADFTPEMRGLSLSNCDRIKTVHNSFGRPEAAILDDQDRRRRDREDGEGEEDQFHFIALMPVNGILYEFDGQHPAPIVYGRSVGGWTSHALEIVRRKIEAFGSGGEIRFNLMALVADRIQVCERLLQDQGVASADLTARLTVEREIRDSWAQENARRRHLMLPLILGLLDAMVKEDVLP